MTNKQFAYVAIIISSIGVFLTGLSMYQHQTSPWQSSTGDASPNVSNVGGDVILGE